MDPSCGLLATIVTATLLGLFGAVMAGRRSVSGQPRRSGPFATFEERAAPPISPRSSRAVNVREEARSAEAAGESVKATVR